MAQSITMTKKGLLLLLCGPHRQEEQIKDTNKEPEDFAKEVLDLAEKKNLREAYLHDKGQGGGNYNAKVNTAGSTCESTRVYTNLSEPTRIWVSLRESGRLYASLRESARVYANLCEFTRICASLRESARVFVASNACISI